MTKRTPPKEEEPSKGLPDSIDLPVTAYLDRLETGKISVGKRFDKQTVYLDHLHAAIITTKKNTASTSKPPTRPGAARQARWCSV